jgi:hypothetical protein
MDKFAVVYHSDGRERIFAAHPILKRLPAKYAQMLLPYLSAQVTEIIMDRENNEELGCMIDVPGFFAGWDKLSDDDRKKTLKGLVRKLKTLGITILCFPTVYDFLQPEEMYYLEDQGIILLDGFHHRLAGMLLTLKQLLYITRKDVPLYETCVWGADTDIGRIWVEAMASDVNHMCIGGQNLRVLEALADKVIKATGLSCQVTCNPEVCLSNKNIVILAEPVDISYPRCQPSIHFLSYPDLYLNDALYRTLAADSRHGIYTIEMGWMGFPQDLEVEQPLQPWEELGVLDGLIYVVSKVYRDDIRKSRITLSQMQRLSTLYEMYPIKLLGFVQNGRRVHFDRFRMDYFRKRRRSKPDQNGSSSKNST